MLKCTSADAPVGVLLIKKQTERKEFLIMVCMSLVKYHCDSSRITLISHRKKKKSEKTLRK